jgi:hypothetical protein
VGCLLLEAAEGSFATAWDDTGDALYAAKWLQEQIPDVQAIIMASRPEQEVKALDALQSVFPDVPVYGRSTGDAAKWMTLSHLGSAEHGISLVGIAAHVGFGAAGMEVPTSACSGSALSASFKEIYDSGMVAGSLKTVNSGILMCSGVDVKQGGARAAILDGFVEQFGDLPIMGVTCPRKRTSSLKPVEQDAVSIALLLFGERASPSGPCSGGQDAQSAAAETTCTMATVGTPSTASTEAGHPCFKLVTV